MRERACLETQSSTTSKTSQKQRTSEQRTSEQMNCLASKTKKTSMVSAPETSEDDVNEASGRADWGLLRDAMTLFLLMHRTHYFD